MSEKKSKWKSFIADVSWFIKEIFKIYSSQSSYFSKKRIESGIAFVIAEWGMIYYMISKIDTLSSVELFTWASIQFCAAGYIISQIQKEKRVASYDTTTAEPEPVKEG